LGQYFSLTLVVNTSSIVSDFISHHGTRVVYVSGGQGFIGLLVFYAKGIVWFLRKHKKNPFHFILVPVGEEPIGWLLHLLTLKRVPLVYDLWDIPGSVLPAEKLTLKELIRPLYQCLLGVQLRNGNIFIAGMLPEGLKPFKISPARIIFSESGYNAEFFRPSIEKNTRIWPRREATVNILYVGYLHAARGLHESVEAIKEVHENGVGAYLVLIGPGSPESISEMKELIKNYGLEDWIVLHDPLPSDEIPGIIAGSDICLCPLQDISKYRWSVSNKIYEYLAMGKPVLATDLPGNAYLIKDGFNGYLYPANDSETLASHITNLALNSHLRENLSKNALASVKNKNWESVVENLAMDLMNRLTEGTRTKPSFEC